MPDTDVLVSELTQASAINTNDLMLMTQPDGESQTGYASRKGTVLQVATKVLKNTEYTTDLPNFDNKSVFGALNEIHNGTYIYKENETPYQLRQTPITANRTLEKLIGVSCAFNQLVQNGNFADTSNWTTLNSSETSISASNNELTVTLLVIKNTWYGNSVRQFLNTVANHVYFITNTIEVSKQSSVCVAYNTSGLHITKVVNSGVNVVYNIFKSDDNGTDIYFGVTNASDYNYAIGDTYKLSNCMLIDLTTCFGSEVADYLYTLESNTAGSGIALFRQLFPEDYYAYQTATLISSKPVSKVIKDSDNNVIATYLLGSDEIRGLLKVENGQLVAYGDIHPSDGNGTEVFDIVDLGSLTWNMSSGNFFCQDAVIGRKANALALCGGGYIQVAETSPSGLDVDKAFAFQSNVMTRLIIRDTAYANENDFKTHLQNDGVYLIYEKATPTAKSYTPFTNPMLCGSTEEFTDSRSVKMFCGHDSLYYTSNFKYW